MAGAIHNKGSRKSPKGAPVYFVTFEFDVDNGNGTTEDDVFVPTRDIYITNVRRVYTEATDSSMGAATTKVGTTAGGSQIVAAATVPESKAVGEYTDLTIIEGFVSANTMICVRHTGIASTQAGKYKIQIEYV